MQHEKEVELIRRILRHVEQGTTDVCDEVYLNPVTSYLSAEQLAREREVLFREWPLLVGLSCQIPKPGDWLTDDFSGVPIVVVRTKSGEARAFANVCRHRGSRVVEGCGHGAKSFTCVYHAWTYGLDGALEYVPDEYGFAGLDRAAHALRPLPVAERHGLLWVRPGGGGPIDLDDYLGELGPEFASYGFETYHHHSTQVLRRKMNWKLVVDTFGEAYHLKPLHRSTVGHIFHQNLMGFRSFGPHHSMTIARRSIGELRDRPEDEWRLMPHAATVYVLFPNTVFTVLNDHVDVFRAYPAGDRTDECVMYVDWYVPEKPETESAERHWQRNVDLLLRTVNDEDFTLSEGIQQNFASGAQTHLTYGRYEIPLQHYHRVLRSALGVEPAPASPSAADAPARG